MHAVVCPQLSFHSFQPKPAISSLQGCQCLSLQCMHIFTSHTETDEPDPDYYTSEPQKGVEEERRVRCFSSALAEIGGILCVTVT